MWRKTELMVCVDFITRAKEEAGAIVSQMGTETSKKLVRKQAPV